MRGLEPEQLYAMCELAPGLGQVEVIVTSLREPS